MNCKNVEELLPLYVGRDLDEERARLVTAHVEDCTQCGSSVKEYGEANQLLQRFEPPQFTEATYTAVRSQVLREIERRSSAPGLLEFLRLPFQPRMMWAVSTAVLLAVSVIAYYFIANRTNVPQNGRQLAETVGGGEQKTPNEKPNPWSQPDKRDLPAPSTKDRKPAVTGTAGGRPTTATNSRQPRLNQTPWHPSGAGGAPAVPEKSAQYSLPGESGSFPNASVTSDKTLRLEIQTGDPNIRIIWFSHPRTNEGSPNESSKGI